MKKCAHIQILGNQHLMSGFEDPFYTPICLLIKTLYNTYVEVICSKYVGAGKIIIKINFKSIFKLRNEV